MPIGIGGFQSNEDRKKALIEKAKAKAVPQDNALVRYIPPGECADRIRVVFDDSGSMCGYIASAKQGVIEFLKNCIPNQTAVGMHFMNTTAFSSELRSDLPDLGQAVLEYNLSSGGTPFFNTIKRALQATPRATRLVIFTDGSPTDSLQAESDEPSAMQDYHTFSSLGQGAWKASADVIIKIDESLRVDDKPMIPLDTVFFGGIHNEREIELLKYLSEKTGGIFLHFDPAKVNFAKVFKYLAPTKRLMLSSGSFRAALENGKVE